MTSRSMILALLLAGCGTGAMGQSELKEPRANGAERLNAPLAVGARFEPEIQLDTRGSAAPAFHLVSARPDVVAVDARGLTARAPGVAAVLFASDDGTVLDFVHVWVAAPTRIALSRLAPNGSDLGEVSEPVELLVGDQLTLTTRLYAAEQRLAGRVDAVFEVDPPIARVLRDGAPDRRRLVAHAPGKAIVTVSAGTARATLPLEVLGGAS